MKNKWYSFVARGQSAAELFIYDQIGAGDWFDDSGVSARDFAETIKAYRDRDLTVRINSPGGNVFDGLAIANLLKAHPKHVATHVDGLAASISTVIALSGKTVTMAESAYLMIHDVSGLAAGRAKDLRDAANVLEQLGSSIADIYVARTSKPKSDILAAMAAETWLDASTAKAWGMVDDITPELRAAAKFNLQSFRNAPFRPDQTAELKRKLVGTQIDTLIEDCKIPANEREKWFNRALADDTVVADLQGLSPKLPGGAPIATDITGHHSPVTGNKIEDTHREYVARLTKFRNR